MSSDILQITAQFTEDSVAHVATPCDRSTCPTIIRPGQKRFYLAPRGATNSPGRHVCGPCFQYYLNKPSTTAQVVPTARSNSGHRLPSAAPVPGSNVNLGVIRTMINESQRQGSHTPQGRVTAVSQNIAVASSHSAHAPQVLRNTSQIPEARSPTVNSPSFFQSYFNNQNSSGSSSQILPGYSAAHLQYPQERQIWASKAYKAPSLPAYSGQIPMQARAKQEVRVLFQLSHYLINGGFEKVKGIKEGMAVDYEIQPHALVDFVKATLLPPLSKLFKGFSWDLSNAIVRESTSWQDVEKMNPAVPYFYGRFLKAKSGAKSDGSLVFSTPKTPIEFSLLVDHKHWMEAEVYMENRISSPVFEQSRQSIMIASQRSTPSDSEWHSLRTASLQSARDTVPKRKTPPSPEKIRTAIPPAFKKQFVPPSQPASESAISSLEINSEPMGSGRPSFKHLDPEKVRAGILLGGEEAISEQKKRFDLKITEHVACFLIQAPPFSDLCDSDSVNPSSTTVGIIKQDQEFLGYLSYDKNEVIGKGTFKTAHLASLNWFSQSPVVGLGARASQPISVALKRFYDDSKNSVAIKRYNFADESRKVLVEAVLLGWASSLLEFAYDFIYSFITDISPAEPPFSIPELRFVKGAVAYSQKPLNAAPGTSSGTSHRAAYLLEELLPTEDAFIKYIHNADAVPLQDVNEPGYNIGVFLCFVQHIQYVQTHGLAYISDFQGAGLLLTDPQVMTHPSLSIQGEQKTTLFGEGNVKTAFEAFTTQHQCSFYCKWFKLDTLMPDGHQG